MVLARLQERDSRFIFKLYLRSSLGPKSFHKEIIWPVTVTETVNMGTLLVFLPFRNTSNNSDLFVGWKRGRAGSKACHLEL